MKLGVVAALETELKPTLQALMASVPEITDPYIVSEAPPFRFIACGVGRDRAGDAAAQLAKDVQGLLSVGFCGALTDDLSPGDILLGGTTGVEPSAHLLEKARNLGPYRVGTVTTVDHVIVDAAEKREIAKRTGAVAVDMESAAVGEEARDSGLPFLCVKVVLDTPSHPLASTYAGCFTVALQIVTRPWTIGGMLADGKRARMAAAKLRDFFVAFRKELQA